MKNEVVVLDPKEFGLEEKQVQTIEQAFAPKIAERAALNEIYEQLIVKEISPDLCAEAKLVRNRLVKVRTGIADIHRTQKAFFLAAGRFVDAWKNKETLPVTQMEEKLSEIEGYYKRIEAEKAERLKVERVAELTKYQDEFAFVPEGLGELTEEVWQNYLLGVKTAFKQKQAAEKAAKEAEEKRIADEKAAIEAQRIENEKLKKEAEKREKALADERAKAEAERKDREAKEKKEREAHEAALKVEREKAAEAQRQLEAKAEAERKDREKLAALEQIELNKGDAAKVQDLINDLASLKTKYTFKSKKNQKMYTDVGILIEKVITHIEKQ